MLYTVSIYVPTYYGYSDDSYSDDPWYAMYNATLGFVQARLAIPEN